MNTDNNNVFCASYHFSEKLFVLFSGVDLTCSYSADFGSNARVEWKFMDPKGSQTYVIFDGKATGTWIHGRLQDDLNEL